MVRAHTVTSSTVAIVVPVMLVALLALVTACGSDGVADIPPCGASATGVGLCAEMTPAGVATGPNSPAPQAPHRGSLSACDARDQSGDQSGLCGVPAPSDNTAPDATSTSDAGTAAGEGSRGPADAGSAETPDTLGSPDAPGTPPRTPPFVPPFILGADISSVHEHDYTFIDTDGRRKSIFALLQNHGFNYVRVKTFVDPNADHGYASNAGGCIGLSEPFSDRDHVIAFGKRIKDAGMGFLLDFHYSDVWADPGKQHIPAAWRDARSIDELAAHVTQYTRDTIAMAVAAGARPDMVQIGNEITPGMLMHVPGPNTDCWGNQPAPAPIGGSTADWTQLAVLLRAGIDAVREVDPAIRIMLHIENTDDRAGALWWVDNAVRRGLDFDVLGLSCYTAFQGDPSVWEGTFAALAAAHPGLLFAIAEYNPERTRANLIMRDLPDGRGLGTFFWEPTRSGAWGTAMFTQDGNAMRANAEAFAEYDAMLPLLGL